MNESESPDHLAARAQEAYAAKRYTQCADLYTRAAEAWKTLGEDLRAAEMLNNCCVALLKAGNSEAALEVVEGTAVVFENANDTRRQALALGNQASALEELHRLNEALRLYQQAADLLKGSGEEEMRALTLKRISAIQIQLKKPVESLFAMDAAVETSMHHTWSERLIKRLMVIVKKRMGIS